MPNSYFKARLGLKVIAGVAAAQCIVWDGSALDINNGVLKVAAASVTANQPTSIVATPYPLTLGTGVSGASAIQRFNISGTGDARLEAKTGGTGVFSLGWSDFAGSPTISTFLSATQAGTIALSPSAAAILDHIVVNGDSSTNAHNIIRFNAAYGGSIGETYSGASMFMAGNAYQTYTSGTTRGDAWVQTSTATGSSMIECGLGTIKMSVSASGKSSPPYTYVNMWTQAASCTTAAAWSWGPPGGAGQTHTAIGNIWIRTDESDATQRAGVLIQNVSGTVTGRYSQIVLDPNGANGVGSDYFALVYNQDGSVQISNNGIASAAISLAGAFTFGRTDASSTALLHTFNAGTQSGANVTVRANVGGAVSSFSAFTCGQAANDIGILYDRHDNTRHLYVNSTLNFTYASGALASPLSGVTGYLILGSVTTAGAWKRGPDTGSVSHTDYGDAVTQAYSSTVVTGTRQNVKKSTNGNSYVAGIGCYDTTANGSFTLIANQEVTITVDGANGVGSWFVLVGKSTGQAAIYAMSYDSATITEIHDTSGFISNTSSPSGAGILGIGKSANSYAFWIKKSNTVESINMYAYVMGLSITSVTDPA